MELTFNETLKILQTAWLHIVHIGLHVLIDIGLKMNKINFVLFLYTGPTVTPSMHDTRLRLTNGSGVKSSNNSPAAVKLIQH